MNNQVDDQLLQYVRSRFFGKYRGLVTDNNDPTNRGRVKVRVPAVLNEQQVWAMPCLPYAGIKVGSYMIPEPDAGVWVEFEGGDPSYAIWTGGFWADDELPKDEQDAQVSPSLRIIRSEKGLIVSFNDDSETLTLSDKNGSNKLTIEVQDGKIKLQANIKVVVEAPQIELVENSSHPVVFGDELLQYLNQMVQIYATHTHPGEMAAGMLPVSPMTPVPPMPQATASLLSNKVKTG
jgi:uncharacterized protein involved in type VI secretion and phage assembly